jgi:integrase
MAWSTVFAPAADQRHCRSHPADFAQVMPLTASSGRIPLIPVTGLALDDAVLSVAGWNPSPLRGISPAAVSALLGSCDRHRPIGRRDYAILMLLCRLGLRGGEVASR